MPGIFCREGLPRFVDAHIFIAVPSMTEPTFHSGRSTQNLRLIESDPLSSASWEALAEKVRGQNDPLSIKSLEVIIDGLKKIEEVNTIAKEKDTAPLRIAPLSLSMFTRLARAYNSPT